MTLKEFIKSYICPNTLVRLWCKRGIKHLLSGHILLGDKASISDFEVLNTVMEWEILNGKRMEKYSEWEVVGVTDILCDNYPEAVNIVIKERDSNA